MKTPVVFQSTLGDSSLPDCSAGGAAMFLLLAALLANCASAQERAATDLEGLI